MISKSRANTPRSYIATDENGEAIARKRGHEECEKIQLHPQHPFSGGVGNPSVHLFMIGSPPVASLQGIDNSLHI